MSYWAGLLEGFQGAREANITRQLDEDAKRRASEGRIYEYLLQSRDPEISSLALAGLLESARPGTKAKGLRGYMGEIEASPLLGQIRAVMDQQVPVGGPETPARPGGAALPDGSPVEPDGPPMFRGTSLAPTPTPTPGSTMSPRASAQIGASWGQGPLPEATPPPGPPPELAGRTLAGGMQPTVSRFKRRGTGVPTAEEIAESTGLAQARARINATLESLRAADASPEEIRDALLGMAGAPRNQRNLTAVTQWGVRLTPDGPVQPVVLDQAGEGYRLSDGRPLPPNAEMVRLNTGGGGAVSSTMEDTPETRAWLIANGADPTQVQGGSGTGYWRVRQDAAGGILVQPGEYTPPPAYSGTATIGSPAGNVVVPIPREGGAPGAPIGPAPTPASALTPEQAAATALLEVIDAAISAAEAPRGAGMPRRPLTPVQRDTITRTEAARMGLPYTNYFEVQQATRRTGTPGAAAGGPPAQPPAPGRSGGAPAVSSPGVGTTADRVRQRLLQMQGGAR